MGNERTADFRQLQPAPVFEKVKKLLADRHYRDRKRLFFAEGIRNFVEAVDYDFPVETIIYSEKLLTSPIARKLVRRLKRRGTPFVRVSPEEYRRISVTERASGVAAIFRQPTINLSEINPNDGICWTAVSHFRSPGNLGTLIRTSAAVGAGGFILLGDDIDAFDPNPRPGDDWRAFQTKDRTNPIRRISELDKAPPTDRYRSLAYRHAQLRSSPLQTTDSAAARQRTLRVNGKRKFFMRATRTNPDGA